MLEYFIKSAENCGSLTYFNALMRGFYFQPEANFSLKNPNDTGKPSDSLAEFLRPDKSAKRC